MGVTLHKSQDGRVDCYQTGRGTSCHRWGAESGRIIRPHTSVMSKRRHQRAPECVREESMRFGRRCRQLAFHQQPQGFLENVAPCFTAGNMESQVHRSVLNSRQKNNSTKRHSTPYWRRRKKIKERCLRKEHFIILSGEQIYFMVPYKFQRCFIMNSKNLENTNTSF